MLRAHTRHTYNASYSRESRSTLTRRAASCAYSVRTREKTVRRNGDHPTATTTTVYDIPTNKTCYRLNATATATTMTVRPERAAAATTTMTTDGRPGNGLIAARARFFSSPPTLQSLHNSPEQSRGQSGIRVIRRGPKVARVVFNIVVDKVLSEWGDGVGWWYINDNERRRSTGSVNDIHRPFSRIRTTEQEHRPFWLTDVKTSLQITRARSQTSYESAQSKWVIILYYTYLKCFQDLNKTFHNCWNTVYCKFQKLHTTK